MKKTTIILLLMGVLLNLRAAVPGVFTIEDIIGDIYNVLAESGEVDQEELQEELLNIAANPISINKATEQDLQQLRFLSDKQIDDILLFIYHSPIHSTAELQLIPSLKDYELRDLLPFIYVEEIEDKASPVYPREVFRYARHELLTRLDVRNPESYTTDPIYASFRYKFNSGNQYMAGVHIQRPTGEDWRHIRYGAYIELHNIWRFQDIVAGNYQAHFGQGLVVSTPFHMGKSGYIMNVASERNGLRKYSGVDGASFHGVGTTIKAHQYVDVSAFYSMTAPNDSIYKHTIGTNLTFHYKRLRLGVSAVENIYTDSLRYYYENAKYNQNYFRGDNQAVVGLNFRWNQGIVDLFGEVAAAQNQKWGVATIAGMRIYPMQDLGLILLYRYYSPTFDNTWGYAFSETSRINDENGLYIGTDIRCLRNWQISVYGDIFRFSGIKYGIPYAPSMGYDTQAEVTYHAPNWDNKLRFRAREKAKKSTFSLRYQFNYQQESWHARAEMNANIVRDSILHLTYGASLSADVQYAFAKAPLRIGMRVQAFDIRNWDNRIYQYEHDVLYAYSIPAAYGVGGRLYLTLRYQPIPQLTIYLKTSETLYTKNWAQTHDRAISKTDIHLLLRACL